MSNIENTLWPPELDALIAAPANHRLLLEDETIRVMEVSIEPGERENLHYHRWPSIMIILARPSFVHLDDKGDVVPSDPNAPENPTLPRVVHLQPQRLHAVEVAADAPHRFHAFRIELKGEKAESKNTGVQDA